MKRGGTCSFNVCTLLTQDVKTRQNHELKLKGLATIHFFFKKKDICLYIIYIALPLPLFLLVFLIRFGLEFLAFLSEIAVSLKHEATSHAETHKRTFGAISSARNGAMAEARITLASFLHFAL